MSSSYVNPIPVAISIVPTIGWNSNGVLLIKRGLDCKHAPNQWALPGGYIEASESAEEAASRELLEETGIFIDSSQFTPYATKTCGENGVILIFCVSKPIKLTNPVLFTSSETLEVKTHPIASLPELAFPFHTEILNQWIASGKK